ncbi:hypothetical protein J5N97_014219 [Dioscorea zingiberensis]|uniref:Pentatricopeptide repeat-containing protein n=1 Tax=Dioscorea zingiberensis TaxID=325984 RepID=A0A9D5CUT7_9LILI|nr:hypothetical protein J5N97_014219 [Dioscorea zingiberensis]
MALKPRQISLANQTIFLNPRPDSSHLATPNHFSYKTLFHHLRTTTSLDVARKLHGLVAVHGYLKHNLSVVLGSQLVHTYVKLDRLQEALSLFHRLPERNSFAWNSILRGLLDASRFSQTIEFYRMMLEQGPAADDYTYPLVLKACSALFDIEQGRRIRDEIEFHAVRCGARPNIYVQCALVDMFAKCGSLDDARVVFEEMPERDLVSWSSMICGTMQQGEWSEALSLFGRMRLEGLGLDSVIVATVIPACGRLADVGLGMGMHCCAVKYGFSDDLCVSNALIDMYCKCGYYQEARYVFQLMECKDVVSWSSIIAGHSQNCEYAQSLDLFIEMLSLHVRPSSITIASVLPAFSELKLINKGKEIHSYAIRQGFECDHFVASALIDLYCQCGLMREAEFIFDIMSHSDIAIGNSLITGYTLREDIESAFDTLRTIIRADLRPNSVTIITLLPLCNRLTMLSHGKELHGYVIRGGLQSVVSGEEAILFFNQMKNEKVEPNKITFIALLSACSHSGLVEMGLLFYNSMIEDYGIVPDMAHYSCMVDLHGRSGCLEDAWEFIQKIPLEPDIDVLGSLLGACRVHKRLDIAELVGRCILEKKTEDPGYHILLSNIYAAAERWPDTKKVRAMIKEKGLMKKPGNSWIQIGCCTHSFVARDRSHPKFNMINEIMLILLLQMRDEGYAPDMSFLHNNYLALEDDDMYDL